MIADSNKGSDCARAMADATPRLNEIRDELAARGVHCMVLLIYEDGENVTGVIRKPGPEASKSIHSLCNALECIAAGDYQPLADGRILVRKDVRLEHVDLDALRDNPSGE